MAPECFPPIDIFQTRDLEFVAWDLGGYKSKYHESYSSRVFAPRLQECEGIVFVVDATEDERRLLVRDLPSSTMLSTLNPYPIPQGRETRTGSSLGSKDGVNIRALA